MPFIEAKTNVEISAEKEKELKEKIGKAIEIFPGKTEEWLMINLVDNCKMYFKGDNSLPMAYVEIKVFGTTDADSRLKMTKEICRIFEDTLSVGCERTYVRYDDSDKWGWNNINF